MKRNVAKEFRNEYYAALHYPEHIAELKLKLEELETRMGYHSPNFDSMHYNSPSRDEKLVEYAQRAEKIKNDIDIMERQIARIQGIMSLVDEPIKSMFIDSYAGKYRVDDVAIQYGYDPGWARKLIDRQIRKAVQMYEDLDYLTKER